MNVEEMYLENIDEYIKDENKIVTYKWLSQTLQVHCNTAKQMLFKYIDTERNVKQTDGLCVMYFVSGLTKPNVSGEQMFKCCVVPEEKLETCKATLSVLTSSHIYSIQRSKLKDSSALYMTDFAKFKENVFESNKFSSIQNERAKLRSEDEMDLLTVSYTAPEPEKKAAVANGNTGVKPAGRKQPQSAIASMFAKADASKKDMKKEEKPAVKEEIKTDKKAAGKSNKRAESMMAFFSKQTDKKVSPAKEAAEKQSVVKSSEKKASPVKPEAKSKKTSRQEDSDEEIGRPKRRRTKQDLFDSDSEEEMEEEPESPIPPTPPPSEVTPESETKPVSPEVEEIENPIPEETSKHKESTRGDHTGKKKRIKKRKLVNKTYMDKDGFMVTEKVYQEESTDASETEEPVKKEPKKIIPTKSPPKGKRSPKKTSPGKKGQGSGKQTSLTSFFRKS